MTPVVPGSLGRDVFVVHGRNVAAKRQVFEFLRALDLNPIEWDDVLARTVGGSPSIPDVLDNVIHGKHAILVLLTPDEVVRLDPAYADGEDDADLAPAGQPRPNVFFEAGMALGRCPEQTIIVQLGKVRSFTDIGGRFVVHLDNSPEKRLNLANRLRAIGSAVGDNRKDWLEAGDLTPPILAESTSESFPSASAAEPTPTGEGAVEFELRVGNHPIELEHIYVVEDSRGQQTVHGDVRNKSRATHTLMLKGTFYGAGRLPLGSKNTFVSDLAGNDVMAFEMDVVDRFDECQLLVLQIEAFI